MKKSKLAIAICHAVIDNRRANSLPKLSPNADTLRYLLGSNFNHDLYRFRSQAASDLGVVLGSYLPQLLANEIPEWFHSI